MPPALDRLLASPSALRLLRSIVNGPELPLLNSCAVQCCKKYTPQRNYSTEKKPPVKQIWRRWNQSSADIIVRERVRQFLETGNETSTPEAGFDTVKPDTLAAGDITRLLARDLAYCERYKGLQGIAESWASRQTWGHALPIEDSTDAAFLWGTYIKHSELVVHVIDHAADLLKNTGHTYTHLYQLIMSYWLPRDTTRATAYHALMLDKLELKTLPLKALAQFGRSTFKPAAYRAFMGIYRNSHERDIYDEVVPVMVAKGNITMARRWHNLCFSRNDTPSETVASHPVIQVFTAERTIFNAELDSKMDGNLQKSLRVARKYNQELKRRLAGRDTAPVRFEDSFCARMFATKTFPPDSIIKGLAMVGVNEIGPQAVLTMALRTEPVEDLPKRFEELRANGIALQGCVFSLALEKFALEQKWHLVRSMLDSDQHPDVFGDTEVQRKLLDFYCAQRDRVQIQRTLAILTLFHNDSSQESWNILLQYHARFSESQQVAEVLQDMKARGVMVTRKSVLVLRDLLRDRRVGHRPTPSMQPIFDDLRFVTRIFMTILESGMGIIPPLAWREIIRRYGMSGRFRELRRLLLWLLCWYAPRSATQFSTLPESPFLRAATERLCVLHPESGHYFHYPTTVAQHEDKHHPIRELFPPSLQQALVIWGFKAGLIPNAPLEQSLFGSTLAKKHYRKRLLQRQALQRANWSIGLKTVVLLRDLGVYVHRQTVTKALQMQFVVLYGRGRSRKKENRVMENVNPLPYATYVHEVNKIWGSQLFTPPKLFTRYTDQVQRHMWHPRMRRIIHRKSSISLSEVLGPDWHTRGTEDGDAGAPTEDVILAELKARFAAQAKGLDPGFGIVNNWAREELNTSK